MDPNQQWLGFFDSGQRYDIYYSPQQGDEAIFEKNMIKSLALPVGGFLWGVMEGQMTQQERYQFLHFFGHHPRPSLGISNFGVHFPEIPLIRWEDIALISFNNLRGVRNRATNGGLIPEPTEGGARSAEYAGMSLLIRNYPAIVGTVSPEFHNLFEPLTTASGQAWANINIPLDPALGAEQVVEWVYLVYLLGYRRGIPFFQSGGMFSPIADMNKNKEILAVN